MLSADTTIVSICVSDNNGGAVNFIAAVKESRPFIVSCSFNSSPLVHVFFISSVVSVGLGGGKCENFAL